MKWMHVQNILRSPQTHAYRNKADFSIGFDVDRKPCAGHFYGLFRNGWSEVGAVQDIPQLSPTAKGYAELMTRFLSSDKCRLPAWSKDAKPSEKVCSYLLFHLLSTADALPHKGKVKDFPFMERCISEDCTCTCPTVSWDKAYEVVRCMSYPATLKNSFHTHTRVVS
jgi:hypothetical protein